MYFTHILLLGFVYTSDKNASYVSEVQAPFPSLPLYLSVTEINFDHTIKVHTTF